MSKKIDLTYTDSFEKSSQFFAIIVGTRFLLMFAENEYLNIIFATLVNVVVSIFIVHSIYKTAWTHYEDNHVTACDSDRADRLKAWTKGINLAQFILLIVIYLPIVCLFKYTDSLINDVYSIIALYLSIEDKNISKKLIRYYEKKISF